MDVGKKRRKGESFVSVMVKIYCPVRIHCRPFVNAANFEPILGNRDEQNFSLSPRPSSITTLVKIMGKGAKILMSNLYPNHVFLNSEVEQTASLMGVVLKSIICSSHGLALLSSALMGSLNLHM